MRLLVVSKAPNYLEVNNGFAELVSDAEIMAKRSLEVMKR